MATFDYESLRDIDVAEILAEFGVTSTLTRWTKGAYSPGDREFATGTVVTFSVTAVVTDFTKREIDGSLVQRDDKLVIIGGADEAPMLSDKITIPAGGTEYEIVSVEVVTPDRTTELAYFVQVRK